MEIIEKYTVFKFSNLSISMGVGVGYVFVVVFECAYMYMCVTCGHPYKPEGDDRCLLLFSALLSCDSVSHCLMFFQLV